MRDPTLDARLADPAFIDDPYPTYGRLRDEAPLLWSDAWGVWVLSRHQDIHAVLRDPSTFSSSGRFNALLDQLEPRDRGDVAPLRRFGEAAFNVDPPEHTTLRGLLRGPFLPSAMDRLRPRVDAIVDELLERAGRDARREGSVDLVSVLALPLPVIVVCEMLGLDEEERAPLHDWSRDVLLMLAAGGAQPATTRRAAVAMQAMETHVGRIMAERAREPRGDLMSELAQRGPEAGLSSEQLALTVVELVIAGHHTTRDMIATTVRLLLAHPDALEAVRADPGALPAACEESLRFEAPIQRGWRRVAADTELLGEPVARGQLVFLMLGSANRDPGVFVDPDQFDIARSENRHLSFGHGIHFCIGAPLARLEAPIAIGALLRRHARIALVDDRPDWARSIHIRGLRTLRVRLSA